MKRKFPILTLLIVCLCCSRLSFAQQKESFHLHLDKDVYLPGETIWFKAYTFWDNAPSIISTNLFVGMYDAEGHLIQHKKYPLYNGTCNGDFLIPDSLESKGLVIQLFTKNSRLADSVQHYKRMIPLFQTGKTNVIQTTNNNSTQNILIQFFPEGGSLLSALSNHVVVMANNELGEPISTGIAIVETDSNRFVDSVFTDSEGLGKIQLMPMPGKNYKGVFSNQQGLQQEINLPAIIQTGAALHAELNADKIYYSVQKNADLPRLNTLQLAVMSGKDVLYKASLNMAKSNQMVNSIPTDSFPPGIIFMTLYDGDNNFLQAKPMMIEKKIAQPFIRIVDKNLMAKGKNSFDVVITDTSFYNLSVSVSDALFDTESYQSLHPEIFLPDKGRLLQHNFTKAIVEKNQRKIDMLLTAAQLPFTDKDAVIVPDDYLSVKLDYLDGNKALPKKASLTLITNDKAVGKQFFTLQANCPNTYNVSGLQFFDSAKVYFQVNEYKAFRDYLQIKIADELQPQASITPADERLFFFQRRVNESDIYYDNYFQNQRKSFNELQTLQSVVVKSRYVNPVTKRLAELDDKYATGMFRGLARGYQLNALDDPATERSIDVYNYIVFRIMGLKVEGPVGSRQMVRQFGGVPILFINESESPPQTLETISTSQLAYVKFIPGIVIGSSFVTSDGALFVYTKKGDEPDDQPTAMKKSTLKGYDISNEFKVIDHSNSKASSSTDFRTTLYWNPYLILDKTNRTANITYYNNDVAKKHFITVRGHREDGSLVEIRQLVE